MSNRTRTEFPESVKRAALERAGHRCQDPQCGCSMEWRALSVELFQVGIRDWFDLMQPMGLSQGELIALRDAILIARFTHARALKPIIKRFKLDGGALLEIDHEIEDADGGTATLDNAVVRCVFCHAFKTEDRRAHRARRPHKKPPEQLDVIHTAKVLGLRQMIDGAKGKVVRVDVSCGPAWKPEHAVIPQPDPNLMPDPPLFPEKTRRHTSEAAFLAAVRGRQAQIDDNDGFFGA